MAMPLYMEMLMSSFNGTEVIYREYEGGRKEKGIFIPFSINGIYQTRDGRVRLYAECVPKKANLYGQSHFIQVQTSRKRILAMEKRGYRPPIIGNMRTRRAAPILSPPPLDPDIEKTLKGE